MGLLESMLATADWYPALVVLLGYLVFGLTGFGSALVIIPLLSWTWPLSAIVPTVLLLDVLASISHTGMNLQKVRWSAVPKVLPFAILGAGLASQLTDWGESQWAIGTLGLYICWAALRGLMPRSARVHQARLLANAVGGTLMGLIETLFGTAGPVVMAWLTQQERNMDDARATAPLLILLVVCIALATNAFSGRSDLHLTFFQTVWLAPVALIGGWIGHQLNARLRHAAAAHAVHAVLLLSGLSLVLRSVLA